MNLFFSYYWSQCNKFFRTTDTTPYLHCW